MIDFLAANWLWMVVIGAFLWLHGRGGGCGMHGGHGDGSLREPQEQPAPQSDGTRPQRSGAPTAVGDEPGLFVEDG